MKKYLLAFAICLLTAHFLIGQEFKTDPRTQSEKEDPMKIHHPERTSTLDLLEAFEVQGIRINKFELGKFDKNYKILLLSDKFDDGILVATDTLGQFESMYRYREGENDYYDFIDKIKIITNDSDTKSQLQFRT